MPVTALCKELDEKASQWVQILPSGTDIKVWMVAVGFEILKLSYTPFMK